MAFSFSALTQQNRQKNSPTTDKIEEQNREMINQNYCLDLFLA